MTESFNTTIQRFGNNQLIIVLSKKMDHGFEKGDKITVTLKGDKLVVSKR